MREPEILKILRKADALLEGHFELRSGLHSNRYFQCANILRYPVLAQKLCEALTRKMKTKLGAKLKPDAVISPAMGGILVGHEVAKTLKVMSIFAEKSEGKLVMHRFAIEKGKKYVVAEDVITRGGRVQEVIDLVEKAGGKVAAVAVLVDRSGGKAKFKYPTFSLLEMEPVTYEPKKCPLCARKVPMMHPGSK
jgi:orotate phosphoribosyltransferase